jgi:hypothetical protein
VIPVEVAALSRASMVPLSCLLEQEGCAPEFRWRLAGSRSGADRVGAATRRAHQRPS